MKDCWTLAELCALLSAVLVFIVKSLHGSLLLNKEKTELLWVGSRYNLSALEGCGPA